MNISDKTVISLGNNENESENQRNVQQKTKNFMSPTISRSSKFNSSPNKKIFSEWKSPRSDLGKSGNSNSSPRKSFPKFPSFSPKNAVNPEHEHDDNSAVLDSFDVPYDPLRNYLSPRPKYLRYRPNRRREIFVNRDEKSESETDSLRESADSQGSSCTDSLSKKEIEEVVTSDEKVVADNEEVEDVDEVEEKNWGLKWEILKCLIVFSAVCLCTMWICCMNSSPVVRPRPRLEMKIIRIWNTQFVNTHIGNTPVVNIGFKFDLDHESRVLDRKYRIGSFQVNCSCLEFDDKLSTVDRVGESVEAHVTEIPKKVESLEDYYEIRPRGEDVFGLEPSEGPGVGNFSGVVLRSAVENADESSDKLVEDVTEDDFDDKGMKDEGFGDGFVHLFEVHNPNGVDEEDLIAASRMEYYQAEIEAQMVASEPNEGTSAEELAGLLGFEAEIHDSEAKFDVEIGSVDTVKATEEEIGMEAGFEAEIHDSEEKFDVEIGSVDTDKATEEEIGMEAGFEAEIHDSEEKFDVEIGSVDTDKATEKEIGVEVLEDAAAKSKEVKTGNEVEDDAKHGYKVEIRKELGMTISDLIWPVISPVIAFGFLASLVWRFYCRCRRASSKTRSSNVKLCSNSVKTAKSKPGLPPKASTSVRMYNHSEVIPPSTDAPMHNFDRDVYTVVIPQVTQLSEFELGMDFTKAAFKASSVRDETMYSTPDTKDVVTRRSLVSGRTSNVQPSSCELSTAESYSSYGSHMSQETTTSMKQDGKEEGTTRSKETFTPRRSTRLRNKGVTSP